MIILTFFKKILGITDPEAVPNQLSPIPNQGAKIYTRSEHTLSRAQISTEALKVLQHLKKSGYASYLVGGCVRDLLLGREPKDFDVVTDATPDEIKKVFRHCRLIGRRFRLAHIYFGREYIEVATFRAAADPDNNDQVVHESGQLLRDNIYGTLEEDVWRRDFTVNALYYNIRDFSVIDFTGGIQDLSAGTIKLIGDPEMRYREDPVRMLRAIRFAVKLGFTLDAESQKPLGELAELLNAIPPARLYEEFLKLFLSGYGLQSFEMLRHYGLFGALFPTAERNLTEESQGFPKLFIIRALENSDRRIADNLPVTPYFLLAALLWDSVQSLANQKIAEKVPATPAYQIAASQVINEQTKRIAFPKHVGMAMRDVWSLQARFFQRTGQRPFKLLTHPKFRAAFDFFLLRAETGEVDPEIADWWKTFQNAENHQQSLMTQPGMAKDPINKRRNRSKNYRYRVRKKEPSDQNHE